MLTLPKNPIVFWLINFLCITYCLFGQHKIRGALADMWNVGGLHLESSSALEHSPTRATIQSSFPSYQVQNCFHQGNWDPRRKQFELVEEKPLLLSWAITERGSPPASCSRLSRDQLVSGILSAVTWRRSLSPPWWAWDGSAPRWGQSSSLPVEVHPAVFPGWCCFMSLSSKCLTVVRSTHPVFYFSYSQDPLLNSVM